ncbi:polysaccharide pyruvyl transferase family protein [Nocardioides zeae]|uniref:Polysaccharide pyruvyl transferase family protein n=1 Tax=Nocardioides imazamoxiresistens TaxID=3231893 RepID=A0ABU3PW80_9ACTN|nr:polysaccharide pyruvyl transferase family protein [Nocardioides zeae]MDT9593464.1 polysaccharide pyruvyl transferase family protein [Nocardioides zeae]
MDTEVDYLPSRDKTVDVLGVPVFRWLPQRHAEAPDEQPENFGDSLALVVVEAALRHLGVERPVDRSRRLLSIGSVLQYARAGDVVWGTGINGKVTQDPVGTDVLDVRAVRGPLTRARLAELGVWAPEVYGDPALLLPHLFPETRAWAGEKKRRRVIVPNLHDWPTYAEHPDAVSPYLPPMDVVREIASAELVVASSLHGLIVADALGVPARPLQPQAEDRFKYDDYARGTGRDPFELAADLDAADALGPVPAPDWDPAPLLDAFPAFLWREPSSTLVVVADADAPRVGATLDSALAPALGRAPDPVLDGRTDDEREVVVVLQGEAPEVEALVRARAADDDRIRVVGSGARPRGEAMNVGVAHARGAYLGFVDGDDTVDVDGRRALEQSLRATGSQIAVGRTRVTSAAGAVTEHRPTFFDTEPRRTTLAEVPDLVDVRRAGAYLFDTDAYRDHDLYFRDDDTATALQPLAVALRKATAIDVVDRVVLHHQERPPLADPAEALARLTAYVGVEADSHRALWSERDDDVHRAYSHVVVRRTLPTQLRRAVALLGDTGSTGGTDGPRLADGLDPAALADLTDRAADMVGRLSVLALLACRPEQRRVPALLASGHVAAALAAAADPDGAGRRAPDLSSGELVAAALALDERFGRGHPLVATLATDAVDRLRLELRTTTAGTAWPLVRPVLDLDQVVPPSEEDGTRLVAPHLDPLFTAAAGGDVAGAVLLTLGGEDVRIDRVVKAGPVWFLRGSVHPCVEGLQLEARVGTGHRASAPVRLGAPVAGPGTRRTWTATVPAVLPGSGVLRLAAAGTSHTAPVTVRDGAAGNVVESTPSGGTYVRVGAGPLGRVTRRVARKGLRTVAARLR